MAVRAAAAGFAAALAVAAVDVYFGLNPKAGLEITAALLGFLSYLATLYLLVRFASATRLAYRDSKAAWGGAGWGNGVAGSGR